MEKRAEEKRAGSREQRADLHTQPPPPPHHPPPLTAHRGVELCKSERIVDGRDVCR